MRTPRGRPHDPEVRWPPPEVPPRSSAASHPGQPRCPLPTCAARVLAAPASLLSDTGDLPTGWLGAKRRADSSPGASGSRGPAPRPPRPDPNSRGAGGGARAARPAVPASSRRSVNSPGRAPRAPFTNGDKCAPPGASARTGLCCPGADSLRARLPTSTTAPWLRASAPGPAGGSARASCVQRAFSHHCRSRNPPSLRFFPAPNPPPCPSFTLMCPFLYTTLNPPYDRAKRVRLASLTNQVILSSL